MHDSTWLLDNSNNFNVKQNLQALPNALVFHAAALAHLWSALAMVSLLSKLIPSSLVDPRNGLTIETIIRSFSSASKIKRIARSHM